MKKWLIVVLLAGCLGANDADIQGTPEPEAVVVAAYDYHVGDMGVRTNRASHNSTLQFYVSQFDGAEPMVVLHPNGTLFATAFDLDPRAARVLKSADGRHWEEVIDYLAAGGFSRDMHIAVGTDGRLYVTHYQGRCIDTMISADEGKTWLAHRDTCLATFTDHQKLVLGPAGPEGLLFGNMTVVCGNAASGPVAKCMFSFNALDYLYESVVFAQPLCSGIVGQPDISQSGILAVPATYQCLDATVAFSANNGVSWSYSMLETGASDGSDPIIQFEGERAHFFYRGEDHVPYFAISDDRGDHWDIAALLRAT